jgi:ABC-type sugar transport system ATPase subunit
VLDEPTASLPQHDVDRLFSAIRDVAAGGVGVVYVSHRLGEVFELANSVSVLRDGRLIETVDVRHIDEEQLIEMMIGGRLEAYYPERATDIGAAVFEAHGLTGGVVRDFSIQLRSGEVVGVTGLNGAGHEELPYLLFGARRASAGRIVIRGRDVAASTITPGAAMGSGVTLLPADRQGASGAQDARVRDNVSLPVLKRFRKRGVMRNGAERRTIDRLLADFSVTPPDGRPFLRQLSGGNQQKALLAKWMQLEPSVLILHEPTQGVDVGSKADIFGRIERAARSGTAVLIASAETDDLAHLCHRVIVLRDGRAAAELTGDALTADRITEHALRANHPNSHHHTENGAPDDDPA